MSPILQLDEFPASLAENLARLLGSSASESHWEHPIFRAVHLKNRQPNQALDLLLRHVQLCFNTQLGQPQSDFESATKRAVAF
jgi:hypothetical protein